jgi:hypothetical protein
LLVCVRARHDPFWPPRPSPAARAANLARHILPVSTTAYPTRTWIPDFKSPTRGLNPMCQWPKFTSGSCTACSHQLLPMRFSPILSLHSWPFRLSFRDADRGRRNKAFSTSWPGYAVARGSEPAVPRALRREPHGEEKITRCFHFVPPVFFLRARSVTR